MDMRIPPLRIKIMLESNPLRSIMLVQRLAVRRPKASSVSWISSRTSVESGIMLAGRPRLHDAWYVV